MYFLLDQLSGQLPKLVGWQQLPPRLQAQATERLHLLLGREAWGMIPYAGQFHALPDSGLALLLIYYQPTGISWSLELFDFSRSIDRVGHLFLVGEQRYDEHPNPERRMKIEDFVVNSAYRSQGLGSWMLQTCLLLGQQSGIRTIWGEIVSTDEVSRLLPYYIRNGFTTHPVTNPDAHVKATISRQL